MSGRGRKAGHSARVNAEGRPVVRLRKAGGTSLTALELTIPASVARHLNDHVGEWFSCELTDEGVLYRPSPPPVEEQAVPSWVEH